MSCLRCGGFPEHVLVTKSQRHAAFDLAALCGVNSKKKEKNNTHTLWSFNTEKTSEEDSNGLCSPFT